MKTFSFKIEHIDAMGQGVSKLTDKVSFIPKTLPGEEGEAIILKKSKGVQFAESIKLTTTSPLRLPSPCPHFEQCNGCHFLHCDYDSELLFKSGNFKRILERLNFSTPQIHNAPNREGYRNRIQLHYDKKSQMLGFIFKNRIQEIPNCLLPTIAIKTRLLELYSDKSWLKEIPSSSPRKGHLEIYQQADEVKLSWNKSYADGGFTQVNSEMNQKLLKLIQVESTKLELASNSTVLDLFSGRGNLTTHVNEAKVILVDGYPVKESLLNKNQVFIQQNLYAEGAISALSEVVSSNLDLLILDPPRSGLTNLDQFTREFCPKTVFYISCNPATLSRDCQKLKNYELTEAHLFDFFPSTYHFESFLILKRKN